MSNEQRCTHLTRRGRPCRNPALPNSRPPACRRHARAANAAAKPSAGQFYEAYMTAEEIAALRQWGQTADLSQELALSRVALRRLMALFALQAADDDDKARQLSALIFTGVRTLAQLQAHQPAPASGFQTWLNDVLDILSAENKLDL